MASNTISYALRENMLTSDPDDRMAQVVDARTYTQDDIIREIVKRGSSLTEADIVAYQKLEVEVVRDIIADGGNVNTPLMNTSFSITGVFTGQSDVFDKARHAVKLNINPGTALRDAAAQLKPQKVDASPTDPYITGVCDKVTGDTALVRVGNVIELTGSRLKFDAEDEEQGVFAITATGETKCDRVIENKPARLLVILPATFEPGAFTLEVRTRVTSRSKRPLKTLKRGGYIKQMTAVSD